MNEIVADLQAWRRRGDRIVLATVVSTRRSAPRPVGAKLAVNHRGEIIGSVSGGCVEVDVCRAAERILATGEPELRWYGFSDDQAFDIGLPCGGELEVFLEKLP